MNRHIAAPRRHARVGAFLLGVIAAAGCSTPPDHTARFGMSPEQTFTLKVDGRQPTVQLIPQFGPIKRVEWTHPEGLTVFNGVPVGGDLLLTLHEGDALRFTDQLGSMIEIRMWNSTGYVILEDDSTRVAASRAPTP